VQRQRQDTRIAELGCRLAVWSMLRAAYSAMVASLSNNARTVPVCQYRGGIRKESKGEAKVAVPVTRSASDCVCSGKSNLAQEIESERTA